jgi:hypothetical protein
MTQILTDDLTAKKFLGCAYVNSMGFVEMVRVDQFGCPDSSPIFRQRKDGTIWYGDKPLGFKTHPEKSMNGMQFLAVLDDLNEAKLFDPVAGRFFTKSPLRLLAGISGPTTDVIVQQDSLITIADGRTFTANPSLILVGATIQQESFLPPASLSPVIRFKLGDLAKSGCARSFSDGNNIVEISTIFNPISTQDQLDICLSSQSTFALMSDDSLTYNGKPVTFATSGGFGQANERNLAFSRSGFGTLDSFRTDISGNKMLRAAFLLNNLCLNSIRVIAVSPVILLILLSQFCWKMDWLPHGSLRSRLIFCFSVIPEKRSAMTMGLLAGQDVLRSTRRRNL